MASKRNQNEILWHLLQEQFSDRPELFPADHKWACDCGKSGFPGCRLGMHFADRVYNAIVDYHQYQGSVQRHQVRRKKGAEQLLRIEKLTAKRRAQLRVDLETAAELLKNGFNSERPLPT